MFQNWGFLLGEIWLLLLLAALLGLFCGWLIWGGRSRRESVNLKDSVNAVRDTTSSAATSTAHAVASGAGGTTAAVSSASKGAMDAAKATGDKVSETVTDVVNGSKASLGKVASTAASAKEKAKSAATNSVGSKPKGLATPRSGTADDLKKIKGIGPKLEKMLHGMGVYHFDQIAAWGEDELAWVDSNLEGFFGRASRDEWIRQAKEFAK